MTTKPPSDSLWSIASRLRAFLASDGASPGLLAELRRTDPKAPSLAALGAVMPFLPEDASTWSIQGWLSVAKAMALAGPKNFNPDLALGAALSAAGLNERRFERLFTMAADVLHDAVWRACRTLRAKGCSFNHIDLAMLLLVRDSEKAAEFRLRQASAYVRA